MAPVDATDSFFYWKFLEEINASFRRFGSLVVDWPHKAESKSYFPPKGYAFLLFQVSFLETYILGCTLAVIRIHFVIQEENSVQQLIESCMQEEDKLYLCVSSPTIKVNEKSLDNNE